MNSSSCYIFNRHSLSKGLLDLIKRVKPTTAAQWDNLANEYNKLQQFVSSNFATVTYLKYSNF